MPFGDGAGGAPHAGAALRVLQQRPHRDGQCMGIVGVRQNEAALGVTNSAAPTVAAVMTGMPQSMASRTTMPNGS